jgi:hypothetical protein
MRKILFILLLLCSCVPAQCQTLVAHISANGTNTFTTSAINCTGANFIVLSFSGIIPNYATYSDSSSNSYTSLTKYLGGVQTNGYNYQVISYTASVATVSSSQTFTATGTGIGGTLTVSCWSGMATSSVFQTGTDSGSNNTSASLTSIQPGNITPSGPTLVITGLSWATATAASINDSFTITDQMYNISSYDGAMAYLVQASGSAIDPTWSFSSTFAATCIAAFKGATVITHHPPPGIVR